MDRMAYIVYWNSPGAHSETISFDNKDAALSEFQKVIKDGFIKLPGREPFTPIRMKVVEEIQEWIKGDLTFNPH